MFRVYCNVGNNRYYWHKSGFWSMWAHLATPYLLTQAEQLAKRKSAKIELFS